MTGEQLYAAFVKFNARRGVQIDSWDEIEETDRLCWNDLAYEYAKDNS